MKFQGCFLVLHIVHMLTDLLFGVVREELGHYILVFLHGWCSVLYEEGFL